MPIMPEIPSERVAVIVFLLAKGGRLRTGDIAQLCGIGDRGARALMARISRVVPFAPVDGQWGECVVFDEDGIETEQDVPPAVLQWLQTSMTGRGNRGERSTER